MAKLQQTLQTIATDLARFAGKDDFQALFADVFGADSSQSAVHALQTKLLRKDFSQLARVEVIKSAWLSGASAAYARASNTIYLSDSFLQNAKPSEVRSVLLEEIGHAIDALVNRNDRPGDEGELFSMLVRGLTPTARERQRIQMENDQRTLTIHGAPVAVEMAGAVAYETILIGNYYGTLFSGYAGSGSNAAWITRKGPNTLLNFFDGNKKSIIANSVYNTYDFEFGISGQTVVFTKTDGQDMEVYRFRGGVTSRLTNNSSDESDVMIDGDTIIWKSWDKANQASDIYRSNGITSQRITNTSVPEEDVRISGKYVTWAAWDGNDYEIYLHDGIKTTALTNNNFDDHSPTLNSNKVAWFQWNGSQEDLFFFDGSNTRQVTTKQDIHQPLISGSSLVYQVKEASGATSLHLYNTKNNTMRQLSDDLSKNGRTIETYNVQASGNLVAWDEDNSDSNSTTLKLFNGKTTATISSTVLDSRYFLKGSKLAYLSSEPRQYDGDLFVFDSNSKSTYSTQITVDQSISPYGFDCIDISGNTILWKSQDEIFFSQPSSKPNLSFTSPSLTVADGFSTPQTATLMVSLSAPSTTAVSVRWETWTNHEDANPAYAGSDYTDASGTLTFAAGVTSQTISVPILNDTWDEPDEVFHVRLLNPTNAVLVPGQSKASITISDTWQVSGANGATFSLPAGVDKLTLLGSSNTNGVGNSNSNKIEGNSGNNRLDGGDGNDSLIGGLGDDTVNYAGAPGAVVVNLGSLSASGWGDDTLRGFENVTGSKFNDTITGDSGNNMLTGGAGADSITGAGGADKFDYRVLTDSLLSSGPDVIPDFNANTGGDKLLVSTARAGFLNGGAVSALTNSAIGAKLTTTAFLPHYAASFQVGSGASMRTYIAINNGSAGFNFLTDTLVNVTGLSGTIDASHFVTS